MSYRVDKLVIDEHTDTHTQATTIPEGQNWPRVIIIYKLIPWTDTSCAACKIVERWIPQNSIDDNKSTLVQVMAWCRQATSHYLSQCWPRSMSPYGVTRPQWVNGVYYTQPQVARSIHFLYSMHISNCVHQGLNTKHVKLFWENKIIDRKQALVTQQEK